MHITRKNHELFITDCNQQQTKDLIDICTFPYHERTLTGLRTYKIQHYRVSDDCFLTSVGFLHGIKRAFPDATVDITLLPRLRFPFKKNYILWREQADIFMEWWRNDGRGAISSVTGSGKSIIGCNTIFLLRYPTLILANTMEIQKDPWQKALQKFLGIPPRYIGLLDGEHKQIRPFTIAIYNSACTHLDVLKGKFELVIFDEGDLAAAEHFRDIALYMDSLYRIAMSATITRADKNEEVIYRTTGDLIKGKSFQELVDKKRISPINHRVIYTTLLSKEKRLYDNYLSQAKHPDPAVRLKFFNKATTLAMSSKGKFPEIIKLVHQHRSDKILIFTNYIDQAERIKNLLRLFNVQMILGKTNKTERKEIFKWFQESKKAIIISTRCLDRGINVPDAMVGIIAGGYGQPRQNIQRVGRTVRYLPEKVARVYEIVSRDTRDEVLFHRRNKNF